MAIKGTLAVCREIKEIARGGQKVVYSAFHPMHGPVVLKLGEYPHPGALERISREVDLLAKINSPYFPHHYGFIVEDRTREFLIIEERVDGLPLSECMGRFSSEAEIIALISLLVEALNILWEQRVVHRDIKPQNIIIRTNGRPVVIDLGIARLLDLSSLTLACSPFGPCTAIYASPEQLQNLKPIIDVRADFFALGLLALQLHLGFHPFAPEKVGIGDSIPDNIINGRYVHPGQEHNISEAFGQLIQKLLATEPYERFRNRNSLAMYLASNWEGLA